MDSMAGGVELVGMLFLHSGGSAGHTIAETDDRSRPLEYPPPTHPRALRIVGPTRGGWEEKVPANPPQDSLLFYGGLLALLIIVEPIGPIEFIGPASIRREF